MSNNHRSRSERRPGIGRHVMSQDEYSLSPEEQEQYQEEHPQQYSQQYSYEPPSLSVPTLSAPTLSDRSTNRSSGATSVEVSGLHTDSLISQGSMASTDHDSSGRAFVTEPPKSRGGLTGKISTLFRREASYDVVERPAAAAAPTLINAVGIRRKKPMSQGAAEHTSDSRTANASSGKKKSRGRNRPRRTKHIVSTVPSESTDDYKEHSSQDEKSCSSSTANSRASASSSASKRIFYSDADDGDSDDDTSGTGESYRDSTTRSVDTQDNNLSVGSQSNVTREGKTIVRYRGFSTSIKSLFLDETVVCASMGCFGLILSNRTEYLLNLRNERRGALKRHQNIERKKLPSRIVAYGLLVTVVLMFSTFVIWGKGSNSMTTGQYFDPNSSNNYINSNSDNAGQQGDDYVNGDANQNDNNNNVEADYYGNNYNNGDANNNNADANNNNNADENNNNNADENNNNNADENNNNNADANDANDNNNADANDANDNNNADANDANNNNNADANDANNNDNAENNNNGNRRVVETEVEVNPVCGIFKLRYYQENLWNPIYEFLEDEWYREKALQVQQQQEQPNHGRHMEDNGGNGNDANGQEEAELDIGQIVRLALLFVFLLFLGILGRRRRMRTRFYLVRARAQEDHLYYASTEVGEKTRLNYDNPREDHYEGACSHTLCGCYPADKILEEQETVESVAVSDSGVFKHKKTHQNEDVVARGFSCFMALCCGCACRCWVQCLSICALAQEAREIRLLVPPRYQRIDFITHQPFHEYQKEVNDLRRGWLGKSRKKVGFRPHWVALSRLSRYILLTFILAIITIGCALAFNPRVIFRWPDAVIMGATFLQSFAVLFIAHWIFHKSDLSLDAVIKMFAAGFMIAVPSCLTFEVLFSNLFLLSIWGVYELVVLLGGESAMVWMNDNWRVIWIFGELVNAYLVTALTEEICKYYTFRTVEHPDLVFLTGLTRDKQDESAVEGGVVKYPFASHQVQKLNRTDSCGEGSQSSHSTRSDRRKSRGRNKGKSQRDLRLIERTGTMEDEFDEDEKDVRTFTQKAMAITTAMIGVAVGLGCAENFIYVFVMGGSSQMEASFTTEEDRRNALLEQWIILVFRSMFPIHALSAALQSINMIRKFVETDGDAGHRIGVGRILIPAVLLHGTFDAVLMTVNYYQETAWEKYLEDNNGVVDPDDGGPYNPLVVNLIAWIGIVTVMFAGFGWYYSEYKKQRERLKILEQSDENETLEQDGTWGTKPDDDLDIL